MSWATGIIAFICLPLIALAIGCALPRKEDRRVSNARLNQDRQHFKYLKPYVGGGDCR